jgi:hypothetical protein
VGTGGRFLTRFQSQTHKRLKRMNEVEMGRGGERMGGNRKG